MNKKILLILALVSGFAFAMRKSPKAIATARANGQKLIGQMRPGARNFDALAGQVRTIIKNLRAKRANKIASDLQMAFDAKVKANNLQTMRALNTKAEQFSETIRNNRGDEQQLKQQLEQLKKVQQAQMDALVKMYEEKVEVLQGTIDFYEEAIKEMEPDLEKYEGILKEMVNIRKNRGLTAGWTGKMVTALKKYDPSV